MWYVATRGATEVNSEGGLNFSSDSSALLSKNMDMRNMNVKCSECGNKVHFR